jgi:hypothetical protein
VSAPPPSPPKVTSTIEDRNASAAADELRRAPRWVSVFLRNQLSDLAGELSRGEVGSALERVRKLRGMLP